MEPLIIPSTDTTPYIFFDHVKGTMEVRGASYDEDSISFYGPAIEWIKRYEKEFKKDVSLTLHFKYLNSSSLHILYELLKRVVSLAGNDVRVTINWLYSKEDDDIRETGVEYSELLEVPFNIQAV